MLIFTNYDFRELAILLKSSPFKQPLLPQSDQPLHLILDLYSVHRDAEIKALANELNIQLHFIPAGMTEKLQPSDGTEIASER